jgi:hypothetical protein
MIRLTLNELRKHVQRVLFEVLSRSDYDKIVNKISDAEPFTKEDIATFAEMAIDFHADDTEIALDPNVISKGWQLLKYLTQPHGSGKNRHQLVVRLEGTTKTLGSRRAEANKIADWAQKDEVDYNIDNFLMNSVEEYAEKIVGGYNPRVVKELEGHRADEEERKARWRKDYKDRMHAAALGGEQGQQARDAGTQVHGAGNIKKQSQRV